MKPIKIFLSAYFLFTCIALQAQTTSNQTSPKLIEGKVSEVGLSEERLARIDAMCIEAIEKKQVPGVVALVARNGKIIYHKAFGTSNATTKEKLQKDDIFRLASQSKAITATAVMMLWEQGKFRLDDPISNYIPEFKNPRVLDSLLVDGSYLTTAAKNEITIRHLLTHTSGIGYGEIDPDERFKKMYQKAEIVDLFTTKEITIAQNIKKLAKLPLHHNPGDAFTYSESYDVLGYFIEVISGMPFDLFLRKHIFDPLEMDDTYFYIPQNKANRLVSVQTKKEDQWINYPITFYDPQYPIKGEKQFFSGGAGLSSTALDYAKFLQMYLNKGELNGIRLLSRTTVDVILSNHINELWGKDSSAHYGLAFMVQNQKGGDAGGSGSMGSFSWAGYFNTQYFADPEEQIIGILLKQTQKVSSDQTGWKFPLLVIQSIDD